MSKNIKKIQSMLRGDHKPTIQVGYTPDEPRREVGDKWTDSDGNEWERRKGYNMKLNRLPKVGIFRYQCKACKKNCVKRIDIDTFKRMDRCYHCQINFEVDLKASKIGENNNKHYFWVKLMMLRRWKSIDKEIEDAVFHNSDVKYNDKKLLNSLANYNQEVTRDSINK